MRSDRGTARRAAAPPVDPARAARPGAPPRRRRRGAARPGSRAPTREAGYSPERRDSRQGARRAKATVTP